jgi:hypothetical protein
MIELCRGAGLPAPRFRQNGRQFVLHAAAQVAALVFASPGPSPPFGVVVVASPAQIRPA